MWGQLTDSAAETVCRTYESAAGYFPGACLVNAGRPALFFGLFAILAGWIGFNLFRNYLRRLAAR